jgi:hypothetical protein
VGNLVTEVTLTTKPPPIDVGGSSLVYNEEINFCFKVFRKLLVSDPYYVERMIYLRDTKDVMVVISEDLDCIIDLLYNSF